MRVDRALSDRRKKRFKISVQKPQNCDLGQQKLQIGDSGQDTPDSSHREGLKDHHALECSRETEMHPTNDGTDFLSRRTSPGDSWTELNGLLPQFVRCSCTGAWRWKPTRLMEPSVRRRASGPGWPHTVHGVEKNNVGIVRASMVGSVAMLSLMWKLQNTTFQSAFFPAMAQRSEVTSQCLLC